MNEIFSRQCQYALQAMLYLALRPLDRPTSIRHMTSELDMPYYFAGKVLQDLTRKRIVKSTKGPGGGYMLSRPPREITLYDIVEAVDGVRFEHTCVLGFKECMESKPCAVHSVWAELRKGIRTMLVQKNLEQLARSMGKPGYQSRT